MKKVSTFFPFVSFVLVSVLILQTPLTLAGQTASPRLLVVELHHGDSYQKETQKISDALRAKLEKIHKVDVVSRTKTEEIFRQRHNESWGGGGEEKDYLRQARERYLQFEMRQARTAAQKALEIVQKRMEQTGDAKNMADIHLLLGLIDLAENKQDGAFSHFKNSIFLQPDKVYTEREYSARVLALLQAARGDVVKAGLVEMRVQTEPPGADVSVDGIYRGQAPITVKGIVAGLHYVRATQTNGGSAYSRVEVDPQKGPQNISLRIEGASSIAAPVLLGFDDTKEHDLPVRLGQVALLADVQKVVLVGLDPAKSFNQIVATVYDRNSREEKPFRVALKDRNDFKSQVADLSSKLVSEGSGESQESRVPYIPYQRIHDRKSAEKRSFWKRPVVWIIGGLLVAGAGAGVGIAMSSGGGGGGNTTIKVNVPQSPGLRIP